MSVNRVNNDGSLKRAAGIGEPGLGIKSVNINSSNHVIITYDDDTTHDAGEITGGGSSIFTTVASCAVGATSAQFTNPLNSTSIVVEPFSQCVSGTSKAITSQTVTASTITLNFAALTEATDFVCRVELIS